MFDGSKLRPRDTARAFADGRDAPAAELGSVQWDELVARLAAARDFRAVTMRDRRQAHGSFDCATAVRLSDFARDTGKDEAAVNPDRSIHCKQEGAKASATQLDQKGEAGPA